MQAEEQLQAKLPPPRSGLLQTMSLFSALFRKVGYQYHGYGFLFCLLVCLSVPLGHVLTEIVCADEAYRPASPSVAKLTDGLCNKNATAGKAFSCLQPLVSR